jgi:putative ABC transport system ATP-binding protein
VTAAVVAAGVTKSYRTSTGVVTPVADFDLTVEPGRLVALHGPSGSGKTAIVHLLAGWERPDRGSVTWPAAGGGGPSGPSWADVAVIPQTVALLDELTVVENITLPGRAGGRSPRVDGALAGILGRLGLDHLVDRSVDQISVGEQQRVMIARALATPAVLLLADEPTGHQDDRNAEIIVGLLLAAVAAGTACLLATRQKGLPGLPEDAWASHRHLA